jgi:hypothetical protein
MPIFGLSVNISTSGTTAPDTATKLTGTITANAPTNIAPSNADRKQLTIYNKQDLTVYFGYANTVSAAEYSFKLSQDGYFELPNPIYTGNIYAFCASNADLEITEFQ